VGSSSLPTTLNSNCLLISNLEEAELLRIGTEDWRFDQSALQSRSVKMAVEETQPKAHHIQSAPEKPTLPASTSSIGAQSDQNEYDEFLHPHLEHSGAPQVTPMVLQPNATGPHDHPQRDQLLQAEEQQRFDHFIFVNEQELQRSRNNELRRAVRSHVRKGTHIKQKRLNAASRPNPTSVKKIVKRPPDSESSETARDTNSADVPFRPHNKLAPLSILEGPSGGSLIFSSNHPINKGWKGDFQEAALDTASRTSEGGLGAGVNNVIVQPRLENFSQISRHQLDSSKYALSTL
jgi:hypothetical protein